MVYPPPDWNNFINARIDTINSYYKMTFQPNKD